MRNAFLRAPWVVIALVIANTGCQPAPADLVGVVSPPAFINTPSPEPSLTPTTAPTPTVVASPPPIIGPDSFPTNINPLTGLVVSDPAVLQRRPLLIKISNAPPIVRPQSGIGSADLMFEHYAEGGQTRFSALFYSQGADHVGSVRSTRLIDLQLAPAYDALLVFSGGSLGVIDTIRQSKLYPSNVISPQFGVGEPTFERFPRPGLPFEHTLFTDTAQLWQWAVDHKAQRAPAFSHPGMAFSAGSPPTGGDPAQAATLAYARTTATWRYDALTGVYLRWTDDIPHTDALTGAQLAFENVIVISAYHAEIDLFPEKYFGAEKSIYIELQGEGPLTLLRDGLAFQGRWHRENPKDMFTFTDQAGRLLVLKSGKTFFQIIRAGFEQLIIEP